MPKAMSEGQPSASLARYVGVVIDPDELTELRELARRVASRILPSSEDGEDIAQEAVLRATRDWARIGDYARPWVVRVATNLAIAQLRRDGRPHPLVVEDVAPSDHVELRVDLADAVQSLPVRQRQAVVLRYLADLDEATVASLLGCSRGSVKRHLHRAVQALRTSPRLASDFEPRGAPMPSIPHWSENFIAAVEPAGGWPPRPWDHWFLRQDGSMDRVAVDAAGEIVVDADGDEVMSGPGFDHEVVKVLPRDEVLPPDEPDPRPALPAGELVDTLDDALAFAGYFGHPWVGDEHLGLAVASRGALPGITEEFLAEAIATFYEGPWAKERLAIVRARRGGTPFVRQPDTDYAWTRALNRTIADSASTSLADVAASLAQQEHGLVARLLRGLDAPED